eukprot:TRINITY_DN1777_c0_g1_i13.p3 TRINITY_DN1777_c0_g1~~TRINITY_DN1777_c0_g1_i13.p3  ORF type:complete len:128 (-),score=35.34 TRINITY_DN1777_c0_g1_i13:771-1154(-)
MWDERTRRPVMKESEDGVMTAWVMEEAMRTKIEKAEQAREIRCLEEGGRGKRVVRYVKRDGKPSARSAVIGRRVEVFRRGDKRESQMPRHTRKSSSLLYSPVKVSATAAWDLPDTNHTQNNGIFTAA